jgi:succinate dehydrogenase flavin-adding protein (antitoxin of CptAB toxin-antitoxin module)
MKFKKYSILLFLMPLFAFSVHKYYISLCEIEYVEEKEAIQIIVGLFIDDVELTLNKNNNEQLHLATKNEIENVDEFYEAYLNKNFKVLVNNQLKAYNYIGKVYDEDIVRFYLEITNVPKLKTLEIFNTNLIEDFSDQQNIIKIKIKDFNKTYYLDKKNTNCLLKL